MLLCLCYRRPNPGESNSIKRFDEELSEHSRHAANCIVMGDMNVHNTDWLTYSNRNSSEGSMLEAVCCEHVLRQLVRTHTRGLYLLDLVSSDFGSDIRCVVVRRIHENDHDGVQRKFICLYLHLIRSSERCTISRTRIGWNSSGRCWNQLEGHAGYGWP